MDESMNMMMGNDKAAWMMVCMAVTVLLVFAIGISIIVQTFIQAKILKERRRINKPNSIAQK